MTHGITRQIETDKAVGMPAKFLYHTPPFDDEIQRLKAIIDLP